LPKILGYYFWERWNEDAATHGAILATAIAKEPEATMRAFNVQLRSFLDQGYEEGEISATLRRDFGCFFDPSTVGLTSTQWLDRVHHVVSQAYPE
jgi:hypothetical protein